MCACAVNGRLPSRDHYLIYWLMMMIVMIVMEFRCFLILAVLSGLLSSAVGVEGTSEESVCVV